MEYKPNPINTDDVDLPNDIVQLTELLAEHTHDNWAIQRFRDGWTYGPERNDSEKKHPGLVPYNQLTEQEKEYDRKTAIETLKAILALGYRIEKK